MSIRSNTRSELYSIQTQRIDVYKIKHKGMNCTQHKHKGWMRTRSNTKVWIVLSTNTKVWCVKDPTKRSALYSIQTERSDVCKVRQNCLNILNTNTKSWFVQDPTQRSDKGPRQDPLTTVLRCLSIYVQTQRFAPRNKSHNQSTKWRLSQVDMSSCPSRTGHLGMIILPLERSAKQTAHFSPDPPTPPPPDPHLPPTPTAKKKKKQKNLNWTTHPNKLLGI